MRNRAAFAGRDRNRPCWCGSGLKYKKCHYNREQHERGNPWDAVAENRKAFQQKKCWAENVGLGPCKGSIIQAHTVSKGSNLKQIAKNGHVLQYDASIASLKKNGGKLSVESIGINKASVFNGFCVYHDQALFSCIENEPYSGRPDQNLAVAYRTLSRDLFCKDAMAEMKTILRDADKGHNLPTQISFQALIGELDVGNAAARRELRATHDALTDALVHQRPSALRSLVIEFDGRLPFMFAGAWSPFTDLHGAPLQTGYVDELLEQVVFASFAGDPGDFICVSWQDTPGAPGKEIADQIDELSGDQKAKFCLQFVVKHIENIFFDPTWFKGLNQGQRDLLNDLAFDGVDGLGAPPTVPINPVIEFVLPQAICSTWV